MTITVGKLLLVVAALVAAVAFCIVIIAMNHHGNETSETNAQTGVQTGAQTSVQTNAQPNAVPLPQVTSEQVEQLVMGDDKSGVEMKLGAIGVPYNHNMGPFAIPGDSEMLNLPNANDCWMYAPRPATTSMNIVAVCFNEEGKYYSFTGPYGFGGDLLKRS